MLCNFWSLLILKKWLFSVGRLVSCFLCFDVYCLCSEFTNVLCYEIKCYAVPRGKSLFLFEKNRNNLAWCSTDDSIVTVNSGVVSSLKEGRAEILASSLSSNVGYGTNGGRYIVVVNSPESLKSVAYIAEPGLITFFAITGKSVEGLKTVFDVNGKAVESVNNDVVCVEDGENLYWEIPVKLNDMPISDFEANISVFDGTVWHSEKNGKIHGYFPGTEFEGSSEIKKKCVSRKLIDFVIAWEGFVPSLVVDCLVPEVYNIGYGNVISFGESFYNNITKRQAFVDFVNKLNFGKYVKDVNDFIISNSVRCSQSQFDALVSFSYNLGTAWLKDSKLKDILLSAKEPNTGRVDFSYLDPKSHPENIGLYQNFVKEFLLRHHVLNPRRCILGLLYRRISELNMFFFGEYSKDNGKLNIHNFNMPKCVSSMC